MTTFTIGFTEKPASLFFSLIRNSGATKLLDVRLNNVSQLAGFAKRDDLKYFLDSICGVKYFELKDLAPSKVILSSYQKGLMDWSKYEKMYIDEIAKRGVERLMDKDLLDNACLLCSEHKPHKCHRRLAVEYLNDCWGHNLTIKHLY